MRQLIQDLQYALRMLAKNPAFTLAVVLMLALGIGVNASVFSFIDFMLLQPLPVPEANRIVVVSRGDTTLFSHPDYSDYRNRTRAFTALAASTPTEASFDLEGQSEAITAEAVSASYQDVMRVPLVRGQWFTDEDQPVAVISYGAWQRRFHGDSKVLGKQVRCLAHWYTVVGVAPPDYTGIFAPMKTDLWVPRRYWVSQTPRLAAQAKDRSAHEVMIFGRLQPGVTATRAAANLNAVDLQIRNDNRAAAKPNTPLTVSTVHGAADSGNRKESIPVAVLLMAVVALVLMVACVNIGNLLLARGAARQRELAIRVAMGASRLCILRQLMTENAVLALAGAAGGLVLGAWTNRLLESLTPSLVIGTSFELRTSSRVIIFVLAVTFLATLLFGLLPAWHSTRTDVFPMLKGESGLRRRFRLRDASLAGQIAISLVLLLSAGLLLRSTLRLQGTDPGFAVNNRLYAFTYVSPPEFTPETGLKFYAKTLDDLRALPGVRNVALTHFLPFLDEGSDCVSDGRLTPFEATLGTIDSGYFTTMKIPLLAGRDFSPLDISGSPPVVIVNQSLADRLWPGRRAVGQHLRIGCRQPSTAEVVGIARDSKVRSLSETAHAHFYRPFSQNYTGLATLVVETTFNPTAMAETLRKMLLQENKSVRIYRIEPVAAHVEHSYWQTRWRASLLLIFGLLALVLAVAGLYGVIAYRVAQRTREIGVRIAIGARPGKIYGLILSQGLRITLLGVGIGLVASLGLTRLLASFLFGVSPEDPLTFAGTGLLWVCVAVVACYVPARRAASIDPVKALRYE